MLRTRAAFVLGVSIAGPGGVCLAQTSPLEPGLTLRIYDIGRPMERLWPLAPDQTPNVDRRLESLDMQREVLFQDPKIQFIAVASGYLSIDVAGRYAFRLSSDDGSRLEIAGREVIDHDGLHKSTAKSGEANLEAGLHPFRVTMFQNDGEASLSLSWKPPGALALRPVPPSAFRIEKGVTRVTSPGYKVLLDGREDPPPDSVHPGWRIEALRPEGFEPRVGGMAFFPDGRLVLSSFRPVNSGVPRVEPNGALWVLSNVIEGGPATVRPAKIAEGFFDPCGVAVVDGDIYISHRPDITRLRDLDGDGVFESREVFVAPWTSDNYHHFSFGLKEHDGWLYGTISTAIYMPETAADDPVEGEIVGMNGPNPPNRGTCYRVNLATREVQFIAGGLRAPNGIEITPEGEVFVSDNQGAWLPASKLINVRPGRFYGHYNALLKSAKHPDGGSPSLFADRAISPPALWLAPNEVCNSPTSPLFIPDGPFAGQFYLAELTMGGIRRICLEDVDGEKQGAVFRFTQGLECGVNRILWGPDGCLYAGGIGADANWSWRGTQFGLERLRPTGAVALEFHSISAMHDGFEVRLTLPVAREWLEDPANCTITQWRYEPTPYYGGPKVDEQTLTTTLAVADPSGRSVRLHIDGLREGSVVRLRMDPRGPQGEAMWSREAWYTLNRIPRGD